MIKVKLNIIILVLFTLSCSRYPQKVESALKQAGDNRAELEEVLRHYSRDPSDALKLEAAEFLIEHMISYASYDIPDMENCKNDLYRMIMKDSLPEAEVKTILDARYGKLAALPGNRKSDLQNITSAYLIRNIDHAFMVWQKQPWGKSISFDTFCHEILPYRIANEPLQDWREHCYSYFQPVLDAKLKDDDPASAAKIIYDTLLTRSTCFLYAISLPLHQGGVSLLDNMVGSCEDFADLGVYILRALGIPCSMDIILHNPDSKYYSHFWNNFDGGDKRYEWEVNEVSPAETGFNPIRKRGKIYRKGFAVQPNAFPVVHFREKVHAALSNPRMKDVTSEYFPGYNLTVPVSVKYPKEKLLYLCVFDGNGWTPVAGAEIKNGKADFGDVEYDIVY